MRRFSRVLAAMAMVAALLGAGLAQAQELRPMPVLSDQFNLETYAAQTETIQRTADNLPDVSFKISLPKTWVERTTLGQDFGELYRFDGPALGDVRPYFSFKRVQMNRENTARNELIAYMLKNGYVLRAIDEQDERNVEAFFVQLEPTGDSFAVRAKARVQGPSLMLAEYAVPVHAWEGQSDAQIFAIQSFKFLKDSDAPVERRIKRVYHDALSFFYPASWQFDEETAAGENGVVMELSNIGAANSLHGHIRIGMYSGRHLSIPESRQRFTVDVPALLRDIKARYVARNLEIDPTMETRAPDLNVKTKFASLDVYPVRTRTTQYETLRREAVSEELWVALFQTDEEFPRTFMVELLTPARTQDVYVWSINSRAFELILKSIQ